MQTNFAYKYRIYPTKEQKQLLSKHFGCVRFVWNYFLNERKEHYLKNKEEIEAKRIKGNLNYYDNAKQLTLLKREKEWLRDCNSQSLQATLKHLDSAYRMFFRKTHAFPNFKDKNAKQSFTIPQHFKLEDNKIHFPKFNEGIKVEEHRKLQGKFVVATLSKSTTNKYYISIIVEKEIQTSSLIEKSIGIDLGIKDLIICSDGKKYHNIRSLSNLEDKLRYKQKQLSKKVKGSNNRKKAKHKVAIVHEKIKNTRSDYIHKITKAIINENQVIIAEDLHVKGMMRNHKLAKAISDVAWHEIHRQLEYKSKWNDRAYHIIDRFFPSSKMCSFCNFVNDQLTLKDRTWSCSSCGTQLDRDLNASINILNQGLNNLQAVGITV
ncbi:MULTISPECIES: RNA-guided endonuclease TnpB family protein [unclassified Candidatus Tisiphia]|uniref:RNA-guided endonuclease TnpB family protein n=1 Tax=unclassified Candidatus Tisiphia TaxID=2996318 RepID=UPI001E6F29EB|nr:MAG: transposase [Rickettsia endosymbiont of Cimex lectularius]